MTELLASESVLVFSGSARDAGATWRARGGRALHVAAHADSLAVARARVYDAIARLGGSGWRVRSDIGAAPAAEPLVAAGGARAE